MSKIRKWLQLQQDLKRIKLEEMSLRKEISNEILKNQPFPAKQKVILDGLPLKVENGVSHKIDMAVLNEMLNELNNAEKSALKWSSELKLRVYKKLPEDSLLHEAITVKPSAPTITLLEP